MIIDELLYKIRQQFGYTPTAEQEHALHIFAMFLTDRDSHAVMIMGEVPVLGKHHLPVP